MRIIVRLYGAFRFQQPGYDHENGWILEMPEGACAGDVPDQLGIARSDGAILVVGSRIAGPEHPLRDGDEVKVLQMVCGG